jgi:hypothetical protein
MSQHFNFRNNVIGNELYISTLFQLNLYSNVSREW